MVRLRLQILKQLLRDLGGAPPPVLKMLGLAHKAAQPVRGVVQVRVTVDRPAPGAAVLVQALEGLELGVTPALALVGTQELELALEADGEAMRQGVGTFDYCLACI